MIPSCEKLALAMVLGFDRPNLNASAPSTYTTYTARNAEGAVVSALAIFDVNYRFPGNTSSRDCTFATAPPLKMAPGSSGRQGRQSARDGRNSIGFSSPVNVVLAAVAPAAFFDAQGVLRAPLWSSSAPQLRLREKGIPC